MKAMVDSFDASRDTETEPAAPARGARRPVMSGQLPAPAWSWTRGRSTISARTAPSAPADDDPAPFGLQEIDRELLVAGNDVRIGDGPATLTYRFSRSNPNSRADTAVARADTSCIASPTGTMSTDPAPIHSK